ncbi:uncharacterized protein BKA55DRAFT_571888 [Fusarium redolens]|uniref:CHAT domain-containing protein n=1 Tax=Fusarium redolens TaxID=48865 RepID=A0A9P9GZA9_FUSRE|nr:uncharacterized protein BKA55DRAFT_571888 [Fusarium redolens]KAH7247463.1 hypothetical protein BKA55DRAFT_571888 [Fusarium redolens]
MNPPVLAIRELCATGRGRWMVRLRYGQREWECDLTDPALEHEDCSQRSLNWVFDKFPRQYPYESARAHLIFQNLLRYAVLVSRQLRLLDAFASEGVDEPQIEPSVDDETSDKPTVVLAIQAADSDSLFHGILWESLESLSYLNSHQPPVAYRVQRLHSLSSRTLFLPTPDLRGGSGDIVKYTFNILFVVSRPSEDEDIDPHLACSAALKILALSPASVSAKVNIEVARPGTWNAFSEHITSRTKEWHEKGGVGPWFDLVHFDVHGVVEDGRPFLRFLTRSGTRELHQSVEKIGKLLQDNEVGAVLMNSCESAVVTEHEDSNLAALLLEYGIATVIGMQFPLTASAATVFAEAFYMHLFNMDEGILAATSFAREMLLGNRSRSANLGVRVELPDYVIPVAYYNPENQSKAATGLRQFPGPTPEAVRRVNALRSLMLQHQQLGSFFGRDYDVMKLEWKLLHSRGSNIVLITGLRGSGKTMLGLWLLHWWMSTGLCEKLWHWSYEPGRSQFDIVSWLRDIYDESKPDFPAKRDGIIDDLRGRREVFFVDALECAFRPGGQQADSVTENDQRFLKDFIKRLEGGKSIVLLTSTLTEEWLELSPKCVFRLHGLSHHHSFRLVRETLIGTPYERFVEDREQVRFLRYMLYCLHFNPASIITTVKGMLQLTNESDKNPKTAFENLLLSWLPDISTQTSVACFEFVKRLQATFASNQVKTLMLLGFGAPTNTWSESFYEFLASTVSGFCADTILTAKDVADFVKTNFIGTGWVEELSVEEDDHGHGPHFLIHPILTNTLRMILDSSQYLEAPYFPEVLDQAQYANWQGRVFKSFYCDLALRSLHSWRRDDTTTTEAKVNSMNYFSALTHLSKNVPQYSICPKAAQIGVSMGLSFSLHLCRQLADSNAAALPFDVILEYAQVTLRLFEDATTHIQQWYGIFASLYCSLCHSLTQFYSFKDANKALEFVRKRLTVGLSVLAPGSGPVDGEDGNSAACRQALQDLVHLWLLKDVRVLRAKVALVTALVLARSSRPPQPRSFYDQFVHVCLLLKRASQNMREGSSVVDKFRSLERRITAEQLVDPTVREQEPTTQLQTVDVLPALVIAWNSEDRCLDADAIHQSLTKADLLIETGSADSAKEVLIPLLRQAVLTGDKAAEFFCHRGLALVYSAIAEWEVAGQHAEHAVEVYANSREYSKAGWIAETDFQRTLMTLRIALIFARSSKWLLALRAFQDSIWRGIPAAYKELSDYASSRAFMEEARFELGFGIMLLNSAPHYLISTPEVEEMRESFEAWFREVAPTTWPDFDMSTLRTEDARLFGHQLPLEDHPSSAELNAVLRTYDRMIRGDVDPQALAMMLSNVGFNFDVELIETSRLLIQKNVNNVIREVVVKWQSESQTESNSPLPPTPELSYFLELARQSFTEEAAYARLDLEPVVTWERLSQVVISWAEDGMPPNEGARASRVILGLLKAMYEDRENAPAGCSVVTVERVVELLLNEDGHTDSDVLRQVLTLVAPKYMAAVTDVF